MYGDDVLLAVEVVVSSPAFRLRRRLLLPLEVAAGDGIGVLPLLLVVAVTVAVAGPVPPPVADAAAGGIEIGAGRTEVPLFSPLPVAPEAEPADDTTVPLGGAAGCDASFISVSACIATYPPPPPQTSNQKFKTGWSDVESAKKTHFSNKFSCCVFLLTRLMK